MTINRSAAAVLLTAVAFLLIHGDAAARFTPNGCGTRTTSWVPEYRFTPACDAHDRCYHSGPYARAACDARFLTDMRSRCVDARHPWGCHAAARVYYGAVRLLGSAAYRRSRTSG